MNIYITDGSESAFYSAAFHACTDTDCIVTSAKHIQLTLDARIVPTEYDAENAHASKTNSVNTTAAPAATFLSSCAAEPLHAK